MGCLPGVIRALLSLSAALCAIHVSTWVLGRRLAFLDSASPPQWSLEGEGRGFHRPAQQLEMELQPTSGKDGTPGHSQGCCLNCEVSEGPPQEGFPLSLRPNGTLWHL